MSQRRACAVLGADRTMAGAIGTSVSSTMWYDNAGVARSEIAGRLNSRETADALAAQGWSLDQIRGVVAQLVDQQAMALATNHVFLISAMVFAGAATVVWLAPKPRRSVDTAGVH